MPQPIAEHRKRLELATALLLLSLLAACSVDTEKGRDGEPTSVDIRTPIGRIQAENNPDVKDTGLAVYPGARRVEDRDDGKDNANVNLSFGDYGLRVVAVRYESDDSLEKVTEFYKDQLHQYGHVLECRPDGSAHIWNGKREENTRGHDIDCDDDNGPQVLQLKVGTENQSRIVTIEPKGSVTRFVLLRIRAIGTDPI